MKALAILMLAITPSLLFAAFDFSPFATATWEYDDNILKTADETESIALTGGARQADSQFRLVAGVNLELDYRGQKLYALANVDRSWFNAFEFLDHDGYEFETGLRWLAYRRLGGNLTLKIERDLENFDNRDAADQGTVRQTNFDGDINWELSERWHWTNRIGYSDESSELAASQDFDEKRLILGTLVEYVRNPILTLGSRIQVDDGEFPNRDAQDIANGLARSFTEVRWLVSANWRPSVLSRFFGEIGVVDRRNDDLAERDLTDVTTQLNYTHFFSRRTSSELQFYRRIEPAEEEQSNFVQRDGAQINLIWNYSHKWQFRTELNYQTSSFESSPGLNVNGQIRKDKDLDFSVEGTYAFTPILTLTPELGWERDRSNDADKEHDSFVVGVTLRLGY